MTEDLTCKTLENSNKMGSPRWYEFLNAYNPIMSNGMATTKHKGDNVIKYKVLKSKATMPILEEYDFRYKDDEKTKRIREIENKVFTSKNSSVSSIRKTTPRACNTKLSNQKVSCIWFRNYVLAEVYE